MNNSGVVTDTATKSDQHRLSLYAGGKTTLVAQGGGQRGIFSSGVLDSFILSNFDPFNEFYGTSAGALNLCAYICRQHGLGRSFILDLTTDPRFFNMFHYLRRKQYLGLDWALDKITQYPYKLDIDLGKESLGARKAFAALTDANSLHDSYKEMFNEDWLKVLIATCAIPRLYNQEVELDGQHYVDGGVSASIPVQEAWRRGARLITVIRTESNDLADASGPITKPESLHESDWFRDSVGSLQGHWQNKVESWKLDWNQFFSQQVERSKLQASEKSHLELMNGGRWLFGADDIYRISHLLGDKFDSGLADMLMVHYQTYSLTQDFLANPPDDCFVVQIRPEKPLKSSSLMSKPEDLQHDYQLGVEAGLRFIELYNSAKKLPKK